MPRSPLLDTVTLTHPDRGMTFTTIRGSNTHQTRVDEGWSEGGGDGEEGDDGDSGPSLSERRREEARNIAQASFPWMTSDLRRIFVNEYIDTGSSEASTAAVRQTDEYREMFPGNIREDGSIRLSENDYFARVDGYKQVLTEFGLPDDEFTERYGQLIEGGVSVQRLENRMSEVYLNIAQRGDQVREYYARVMGIQDISNSAIMASTLKPDINIATLERKIRKSQIGGSAARSGFDLELDEARRLAEFGLEEQAANQLYTTAARQLPTLTQLLETP